MVFIPTYLYIKQHSITGLKYFGKTTKSDPYKYNGSGKHWLRHIKKYGKEHVVTLWVSEPYIDSILISDFALAFSKDNNIVESVDWANLIDENGLDGGGGFKGKTHSEETKAKQSASQTGQTHTDETRAKQSIAMTGKTHSDDTRAKQSIAHTGKTHSEESRAKMSIAKKGKSSPNKGKTTSNETKAKQSAANIGKTASKESRVKISIAKTILHDILTPDGFVLEQISMKELCSRFNLNNNSVTSYFNKNKAYKGFLKII